MGGSHITIHSLHRLSHYVTSYRLFIVGLEIMLGLSQIPGQVIVVWVIVKIKVRESFINLPHFGSFYLY
jgi:hypothetical protein